MDSSSGEKNYWALAGGGIAFLILPVAIFSSKAMTPLFILLAFVLFAQRVAHRNYQFAVPKLPFIAFIHLLIWAGLSVFWSFDQALSARLLLPLLALFAMGVFALDEVKSTAKLQSDGLEKALIVGAGLAIALLFFESVTGSWLTRQGRGMPWYEVIKFATGGINIAAFAKNGVVILSILIWPVMSGLWRRHQQLWAGAFVIATIYLVYRFSASTALVALAASLIGVGLAIYQKKFAAIFVASVFAILVLSAPFVVQQSIGHKSVKEVGQLAYDAKMPNSAINRFIIWQFATKRILEKPFVGWGMNTARQIPGGSEKYTLRVDTSAKKNVALFREFYVPLHTHNQAIQIWLELGAVGAIFVAAFGWLFIRKLGNTETDPALFGVVISILVFNFLSYGAWQSWWIATQFLCLFVALASTRKTI